MDDRSSPDPLRSELARRGLPADYVERVAVELGDHRDDLVAEASKSGLAPDEATRSAAERLGRPEYLAGLVARAHRRRRFAERHPVLGLVWNTFSFVVAPVPVMVLAWFAANLLALLPMALLKGPFLRHSTFGTFSAFCHAIDFIAFFGPPAAVTAFQCRRACRGGRGRVWLFAACATMALLTGAFRGSLRLALAVGKSSYEIFPDGSLHALQMLVPLAIGMLYAWRLDPARRRLAA